MRSLLPRSMWLMVGRLFPPHERAMHGVGMAFPEELVAAQRG